MNSHVKPVGKCFINVARFAAFAVIAAVGTSCTTEVISPINGDRLTTLVQVDPVSRTDTTYVGDVFDIPMPHFRDATGKAIGGFDVSRTTTASTVARPSESLTRINPNAIGTMTDSLSDQMITIQPLKAGAATLSVATVLTDLKTATQSTIGVTTPTGAPLVFTHNVIVLPDPPTILNLPSVIHMQVGDTLTLAPMPRGSSGGTVTTGSALWNVESGLAVATLHPLNMTLLVWPNTAAYTQTSLPAMTKGGTGRIGLKGRSPGEAELVVIWASAGGARIQKTITVIVTARSAPTIFTSGGSVDDPARESVPVTVGKTRQFSLRDVNNVIIPLTLVDWLSSSPTIADITPSGSSGGLATCRSEGTVTILANVASTGDIASTKLLCGVQPTPTITISITPPSASVKVGSDITFNATAIDPLLASSIKWNVPSTNAQVVSVVSSSQLASSVTVRGVHAGEVTVMAFYGEAGIPGASVTATLMVTARTLRLVPATTPTPVAAGATQQYTVEEVDAGNNRIGTIPVAEFTWSPSESTVADVDANGKATCAPTGAGGTIPVSAIHRITGESLTATLSCSPPAAPPSTSPTVVVNPHAVSVSQGRTTTIAAVVTNGLNVTDVTWSTKDAAVATISDNGSRSITINGIKAGSSTYIVGSFAYSGGTSRDSTLVTVTNASTAQVDHITLEPDSVDVAKGALVQYRVRYWNASNVEMNGEVGNTTAFTVDVSSVAQIGGSTGLVTTRGLGSSPVTASYRMPYYDAQLPLPKASLIAKAKVVVH
jgi:hypothetical protein